MDEFGARGSARTKPQSTQLALTNYGSHFAQHIIFKFSRPPRQNPHYTRIYQSTKDPSLWQQPLRQRRGLSSPQTRFGRRSLRPSADSKAGAEKRDRCACGQPGG